MKELPENKIENKGMSGFDFAGTLKMSEILKELGVDPYNRAAFESMAGLRSDIAEIISNLSRTLSVIADLRKADIKEIELEVDRAISGESKSLTTINLSEEKKQKIKNVILGKLLKVIE